MKTLHNISNTVINSLNLILYNIYRTHKNLINKTRNPEKGTSWIKLGEFKKYSTIVTWITRTMHLRPYFNLLLSRIEKLIKASSSTWAFAYMKETLRLTTRALAGTPELISSPDKIRVKRDHYGLPTIIPLPIRNILRTFIDEGLSSQTMRRIIIATLTIISIFRSFPTKVEADLSTITGPFTGSRKDLPRWEVQQALKTLVEEGTISFGKFHPVVSQKAGPNVPFSTWGAAIDALAFVHSPTQLYYLSRWMYIQKAYAYILWLYSLIIVFGGPYFIVYLLGGTRKLFLGKLSVVYNQAGKARIVAATNWWMQSALFSLHESIFYALKNISQDGTFDQEDAFNRFINRSDSFSQTFGNKLSGFDLSAATDRLPIDLQTQILNELGLEGDLWQNLLNINWLYSNKAADYEEVRYAVGQPMGAYSSWAMLALTHHTIVRVAAVNCKIDPKFVNYAVLGDDIVINNDKVAQAYLLIMAELGVSISLGKSIVSYKFTEFAKKLAGPGLDITPFGSGLILSALRSHYMVPGLIAQAIKKFKLTPQEVLDLVRQFPAGLFNKKAVQEIAVNSLWYSFVNNTWLKELSLLNVKTLNRYSNFFAADAINFPFKLVDTLVSHHYRDLEIQKEKAHEAMTNFLMEAVSLLCSRTLPLRILEFLMKPVNPGFWIYMLDSLNLPLRIDERYKTLSTTYRSFGEDVVKQILYLRDFDPTLSVLDIAKLKPARAKAVMKYYKNIAYGITYR